MAILNSWLENPWKLSGELPWVVCSYSCSPQRGSGIHLPARPVQSDLLLGPTQLRAQHSVNLSGIYE